jgi:cytochrome b involved in lipid metabolism
MAPQSVLENLKRTARDQPVLVAFTVFLLIFIYYFTSSGSGGKKQSKVTKTKRRQGAIDREDYKHLVLTAEEVAKHNNPSSAWLIVDDRVFDLTTYLAFHPGGDAMVKWLGKDATKAFKGDQHPSSAADVIEEYFIGNLVK